MPSLLSWRTSTTRWRLRMRQRFLPRLGGWVAEVLLSFLFMTCRFRVRGRLPAARPDQPQMVMLWHSRLAVFSQICTLIGPTRRFAAVISNSRDGELLSAIASMYPQGTAIRVPHNARHRAVKEIIRHLNSDTIVAITPDGPKGPAETVKKGAAYTARATRAAVVPITWEATRFWCLPTWDRMRIPKPFSRVTVVIGDPVPFTEGTLDEHSERFLSAMRSLDAS